MLCCAVLCRVCHQTNGDVRALLLQSVDARRAAARRRAEEAAKKEEEELSAQEASRSAAASGSWFATSSIGGFFQKLAGNKVLDDEDIAPVMERMREQLLTKNVASEVADELCKSVGTSLVGQRLERLTRIATVVRTAMQVRAGLDCACL